MRLEREKSRGERFREEPGAAFEVKTVVKPVINAIAVLRYLADGHASTATRIARDLGVNTSTCFNILRTLVGETILAFDAVAKTYKLGPGMLQLVAAAMSEDNRVLAAKPLLRQFASRHHATMCLWRRASVWRNVLVAAEHAEGAVRIHVTVGQSMHVLLGSTGRVMAIHLGLTKRETKTEFKKLRWYRAPDFETYWADARTAHARGWAVDKGNFSVGVTTISTPVINSTGAINYSLTALVFKDQHDDAAVTGIGEALRGMAETLSPILY